MRYPHAKSKRSAEPGRTQSAAGTKRSGSRSAGTSATATARTARTTELLVAGHQAISEAGEEAGKELAGYRVKTRYKRR